MYQIFEKISEFQKAFANNLVSNVSTHPVITTSPVHESGTQDIYDVMEVPKPKRKFKPTVPKTRHLKKQKLYVIMTNISTKRSLKL
jgi:hypothetical protein